MAMTTDPRTREFSPQALVMAQIADEDKPMPSDDDVQRIAREHHLPHTEAKALVRFARAVAKIAEE
jgi:3,4-dihydroxy-2-butanone 4-phosphate synthase